MVQEDNVEQLLNSAKNATSVEEAIEEYNKALEINPNDIHILKSKIDNIWDFYDCYDDMYEDILNELLETANQALEIDKDDFNLWWVKIASIQTLYSLEAPSEKAMKCFVEALEVSSYDTESLLENIESLNSIEEDELKFQYVNKAIEVNPNNVELLKDKADYLCLFDKFDEAVETINEALKIEPENIELLKEKSMYLNNLDKYDKAIETINEALEIEPENIELLKDKADYLCFLAKDDNAVETINEALKIEPENVELLKNKSLYLNYLDKSDKAVDAINEALKIEPDNTAIWKNKIELLNESGKQKLASQTYKEAYSYFYNKGIECYNNQDYDGALYYLRGALKISKNDVYVQIKMGDAYFKKESYGRAKQKYIEATKYDSENVEAWYKKGLAMRKAGKTKEAKTCFDEALRLNPDFEPNFDHEVSLTQSTPQYPLLDMLLENKKQVILYGPPGTGKTYLAQQFIKSNGNKTRSKFVTFHQSYAYEEFIEGLRPQVDNSGNIRYQVNEGIFKQICRNSLNDLLETCEINKKWDDGEDVPEFSNEEIENIRQVFSNSDIPKYYLVIDEINRGDISRIFGELITALETDKRLFSDNEIVATLPYSNRTFAIPPNLYILGTMNTADKSIALIDIALRRRFSFLEMMPDYNMLERELNSDSSEIQEIYKLGISALRTINERIEQNYDRDHVIGHSYLLKLKDAESKSDALKKLKYLFYYEIIPLLQEYYYDSPTNLQSVIGKKFVELRGRSFKINDKLSDIEFFNELCNLEE